MKKFSSLPAPVPFIPKFWEYEDRLPPEISEVRYAEMYPFSRVINGVRMFPYSPIGETGRKYFPDVLIDRDPGDEAQTLYPERSE